ncbi:YcxB family protein [Streptomyces cinnamoneus]
MNTTGGAEPAVGAEIEAYYSPRPGDAREAMRWYARKTAKGRAGMLMWLGLPLAPITLGAVQGMAAEQLLLLAVLGPLVGWYGAYLSLDRQAHRLYEWAARHREYHCIHSDTGVVTRMPDGTSSRILWSQCAGFGESRNLILLLTKEDGTLLWLPKRAALTDQELDRIRELLGRKLRRL